MMRLKRAGSIGRNHPELPVSMSGGGWYRSPFVLSGPSLAVKWGDTDSRQPGLNQWRWRFRFPFRSLKDDTLRIIAVLFFNHRTNVGWSERRSECWWRFLRPRNEVDISSTNLSLRLPTLLPFTSNVVCNFLCNDIPSAPLNLRVWRRTTSCLVP